MESARVTFRVVDITIVVDKREATGGWVTKDYARDLTGSRVFVVTAQTPADSRSPQKSWNFYFTELNGRIYSLTTTTPVQFSDQMTVEAEKYIGSLHADQSSASLK